MEKLIIASVLLGLAAFVSAQVDNEACIECNQLDPADIGNCIQPSMITHNLTRCIGTNNNNTCFSYVNEHGHVQRGCANLIPAAIREICEGDSETCQTCVGGGCNQGLFPRTRLSCHICTGPVNSNCSGTVTGAPTVCRLHTPDDRCFIARPEGPEGPFERGCLSMAAPGRCGEDEACHVCDGNGCNNEDYNSAFSISSGTSFLAVIFSAILILLK